MKEWAKKNPLLKKGYRAIKGIFQSHATKSYSQEGEDLLLGRIFEGQKNGFYVDVGAHHPLRFSNTYRFYKQGWHGINIDAMPNSMKLFNRVRPRDINLETPIGQDNQTLQYYIFNERALNTFKSDIAKKILQIPHYELIETKTLKIRSLKNVLDQFLPPLQKIDFMSIDVEGLDLEVLQSNDWTRYRPKILLVEMLGGGAYKRFLLPLLMLFYPIMATGFLPKHSTLVFSKIRSSHD